MGLNKEVNLIVSVLLLVSASAFAQPGYQPPGPPFYVYDVPLDANGNLTKPTCMSADGNIPDFATIPGGNIATVAMGAQTNATNGGFSPPCSTGSSFTSTGTGFSETGNLSITSATDTGSPNMPGMHRSRSRWADLTFERGFANSFPSCRDPASRIPFFKARQNQSLPSSATTPITSRHGGLHEGPGTMVPSKIQSAGILNEYASV